MPRVKIAHIREQGVDLIIVPLDDHFGDKVDADQDAIVDELQLRSNSAGLAGAVVPVWNKFGRMHFKAPRQWHAFFQSINMEFILRNLNRELSW